MSDLGKVEQLKKKTKKLESKVNRAEGELDGLKKQLVKEFDCDSLEEAEELLEKLEQEEKEAQEEFDEAYNEFTDKWEDVLGEVE